MLNSIYVMYLYSFPLLLSCAGTNISSREEVAIKLECVKTNHPQLHIEAKFYKMMQSGGTWPVCRYLYIHVTMVMLALPFTLCICVQLMFINQPSGNLVELLLFTILLFGNHGGGSFSFHVYVWNWNGSS